MATSLVAPVARRSVSFAPAGPAGDAAPRRPRLLLVDDEPRMLTLLHAIFEPDYDLRDAYDGEEALAAIARERPDLVLLDVSMPRLDGFTACERLRANPATADLDVIILTAFADAASRARAFAVGATEFVSKPYSPIELMRKVESLLARRAAPLSR